MPSITTSDGQTFKDVKVFKVKGDDVLLVCSAGSVKVPLASLSDEARKMLGLRTRDEQAAFEAGQKGKGLVKSGDDWVTPEEKRRREAVAKYNATLNSLVPDWRDINVNPQFAVWLDVADNRRIIPLEIAAVNNFGQTRRQIVLVAIAAYDAVKVAKVFNAWKADQKAATAAFVECLSNLVPDWRDVIVSPLFLAWIPGGNWNDRWTQFARIEQARGREGAEAIANIMLAWKAQAAADRQAEEQARHQGSGELSAVVSERLVVGAAATEEAQRQYAARQRAWQAIQDQIQAIHDRVAANQSLQNKINAQQRIPPPPPSTAPSSGDPSPGH